MEEELKETIQKINSAMRVINSPDWGKSFKQRKEKELIALLANKKDLENKITEGVLLDN